MSVNGDETLVGPCRCLTLPSDGAGGNGDQALNRDRLPAGAPTALADEAGAVGAVGPGSAACPYCRDPVMVLSSGLAVADPGLDVLLQPTTLPLALPPPMSPPAPPPAPPAPASPVPPLASPAPAALPEPAPAVILALAAAPVDVVVEAVPAAAPMVEPEPAAPPASDRRARIVVWVTWLTTLVSSSAMVLAGARNVPIQEDWHVVPAVFGHQRHFWSWLWMQNNEHRVPLPKLIYVGLLRGWTDFRAGMIFTILVLALISAACIVAARHLRGRTRWTDAFFPLVLLHLGHWENLGWGWQLTFVFAAGLACCLLLVGIWGDDLTSRRALIFGGCAIAIPLSGATALPFVPLVAAALLVTSRRSGGRARRILVGFSVASAALMAVYFFGLQRPDWVEPSPGLASSLLTGAKVLALSIGPAAGGWWFLTITAVAGVFVGATVLCYRARAWTPLAFLMGGIGLALLIGHGRAGLVPTFGLPDRYAIVVVPALCCAYFAYDRYGGPRARRLGPAALCLGMLAVMPLNVAYGMQYRDWYHQRVDTFAADIRAGIPLGQLASYRPIAVDRDEMSLSMYLLRQGGIGPFTDLLDENAVAGERTRVDGFDTDPDGWVVSGDVGQQPPASTASLEISDDGTSLRWDYHVTQTWAVLARAFDTPQDWRGTGALEVTFRGQATGVVIRVRLAMTTDGEPDRYDSLIIDDQVGTRTVVLPWNAFGHVDENNLWDSEGPMPLDRVGAVVFIATRPGTGQVVVERLAVRPGHGQLGWPLHPSAARRSWAPWH